MSTFAKTYGTFAELRLGGVLKSANQAAFRIYRFKRKFEDAKELVEVQITFD